MKLGIAYTFSHRSPEEWVDKILTSGCQAAVLPDDVKDERTAYAYGSAALKAGIMLAEVHAWSHLMSPDRKTRERSIEFTKRQLRLAEAASARCCVNVAGGYGPEWDSYVRANFSEQYFERLVETIQTILDDVSPVTTNFALECMPWMPPYSAESYLSLISAVNRTHFAAHVDIVNLITSPYLYLNNAVFSAGVFQTLGSRIISCHIKDVIMEHTYPVSLKEVPCGTGGLDLSAYIQAAETVDKDMPMIIEHLTDQNAYIRAIDFVKREFMV